MARRLLTLQSKSDDLTRLTQQLDRYAGELGKAGVEAYTETLNEYKFKMRDRSEFGPLYKRTGRLRSSWNMEVTGGVGSLQALKGSVFSHAGYAVIHEEGGEIRPADSTKWIYIPTIWNLKANRTAKLTPAQVIAAGGQFMRQELVDADKKAAMTFVSSSLLVDVAGFPAFCLVKRATYAAQLGTREQEPIYSQLLVRRLADRALVPLEA